MRLITAAGMRRRCARETNGSVPTGSTSIHDLADELLELVFLHLSSPVYLVRAAAACRPWRRVIAADGFLRRFRSLHGPHVLGHFNAGAKTRFVSAPSPPGEEKRVYLFQLCNVEEGLGRPWHFLELSETVAPGCVMLSPNHKCTWMFHVDVETMEVEHIEKRNWHKRQMLPYELPWPPTIKGEINPYPDMENKRRRPTAAGKECRRRVGEIHAHVKPGSTNIHDLADDLLERVFLRLKSPVCLVRAAAACKPWRRLVAAADFLRCFYSLHGRPVLGHYLTGSTIFFPSPALPGEATVSENRLSLNFFNNHMHRKLMLTDRRGLLLAFVCNSDDLSIIVVCNPWTRQYREVLPSTMEEGHSPCLGTFLLDADKTGTTPPDMSNFRVLCLRLVHDEENLTFQASVFSAREDRWLLLSSTVLAPDMIALECRYKSLSKSTYQKGCVGRVGSSLFLYIRGSGDVLHVNESTGALSLLPVPGDHENQDVDHRWKLHAIRGENATSPLRFIRIVDADLEILRLDHDSKEFVQEKRFGLSQLCNVEYEPQQSWHLLETGGEALAPAGCVVVSPYKMCAWMFYVDVESMEVQRVQKRNAHDRPVFSYELPWPPTFKACQ
ncbi:hypothetical protein PR202_gb24048 [Eleusine coracana subsp. coracana]|uniref:F-box domain-containing protein n=1 Tax=Eleusine coracana subsp. coracana TaxID=191504 RepID=A0AAV5FHV4_ELECO|nr:hypothetical protein PR202_gb24048 [Eleusine coracana subsp. coracana]